MFVAHRKKLSKKLTYISWAGLVVLAFHFIMVGIYALDFVPLPAPVRSMSTSYTVPFFHQSWTMFAPEVPAYDVQLEFRVKANDHWKSWQDATSTYGYDSRHRMEYIEQSICSGLSSVVANNLYYENGIQKLDAITKSFDYNKAVYFVYEMHERHVGSDIQDSLQLRLTYQFTPPFGVNEKEKWGELVFPSMKYDTRVH